MTVSMQLTDDNAAEMRLWIRRHGGTTAYFLSKGRGTFDIYDTDTRTWQHVDVGDWVVVDPDGYLFRMRQLELPMPEPILLKRRMVLEVWCETARRLMFIPTDSNGDRDVVFIESDTWADMGHPKYLTVTLEPGDLLNV
jgi:hypothetical protein